MIDVRLHDGKGSGNFAKVNGEGELSVVVHPHPPINHEKDAVPYRSYFENGGSNDMIVNGATTAVDFTIEAIAEFDIYIKSISIEIADGGSPALNKFGALTALTNGVGFYWSTQSQGEYEIHEGIKTNLEFIRIGVDTAGVGTGADAFLSDVSGGGTSKSYLPIIDMSETFGIPFGLRLKKGSTDKLIFRINDNMTGLDRFTAIAYGLRF
jgi:hypothetical protein